ncbi:unnamed protein product [Nippostrongylus brasiliensis]|uniref:Transcriptional regulator n=1 Tax=Nippostrongylus brasiliensis TaxID=27835 RepID=A0A0N4XSV0_NIPBR|nr:unnamed protein product [Nippostrongylus brasiliensis]
MLSNKTRSLNFNQTLEELLGSDRSKARDSGAEFCALIDWSSTNSSWSGVFEQFRREQSESA